MVSKNQEIYVSIDPQDYKAHKSLILSSQIDILNCIKHLHNIKKIRTDKTKLKSNLRELSFQIVQDIDKLTLKLPQVNQTKIAKEKKVQQNTSEIKSNINHDAKKRSIEEELKEIQAKLKKLNS